MKDEPTDDGMRSRNDDEGIKMIMNYNPLLSGKDDSISNSTDNNKKFFLPNPIAATNR
jgi:hypothetical protein